MTAYVDGVAEISPAERHRIEARLARDPEARAEEVAVRALVGRLRSAARDASDAGDAGAPDWAAMERSIRDAVGTDVPRPWWRRWTWLVPSTVMTTAAAVMLALWARPAQLAAPSALPLVREQLSAREPAPTAEVVALWLDGNQVDVDLAAWSGVDPLAGAELPGVGAPGSRLDGELDAALDGELDGDADMARLLPTASLTWVNHLDDAALERAETWLARKKG